MTEEKINNISQEDIDAVRQLQEEYQRKMMQFGQLKVERLAFEQRKALLDDAENTLTQEYDALRKQETELIEKLNDKYGPGTLDIDTGQFTAVTVEE